ncbi:ABC transporter permease [uncultured Methanobacterium sp.]|uniref:ABC transporter permease n=1 Tax=uncultured Methanobacterium sp. TaxID=176306 RepID=UPI002AA7B513|nr:ABC transporter permease [uncultured Methanobacterium sp.]
MGIYTLSWKNLRRNRLRNLSTVLRISLGVIILLILVSSGLGISSVIEKSGTSNGKILGQQSNQTASTENETSTVTTVVNYLNSLLGSTFTENQLLSRLETILVDVVYILDGLASIALLIGVLGIMNTMGFNLSERKREIGLLKCMGFTKRQIFISCTLESGLLGLIGSIIGVIIGTTGIWIISAFFKPDFFTTLLPFWLFVGTIAITTILSLVLGLYPAWFTSHIKVEEALLCEY